MPARGVDNAAPAVSGPLPCSPADSAAAALKVLPGPSADSSAGPRLDCPLSAALIGVACPPEGDAEAAALGSGAGAAAGVSASDRATAGRRAVAAGPGMAALAPPNFP